MSVTSDFSLHKQYSIYYLYKLYNSQVNNLYNSLQNSIISIQRSNVSNIIKKSQISTVTNQYNIAIFNLKNKLQSDILLINNSTIPNNITNTKNLKGLVIGINYLGSKYELSGCITDASNVSNFLSNNGFLQIKVLTDNTLIKPTRVNILNEFTNLLSTANAGDVIFFSYSGHGSYKIDTNNDELTRYDQLIVPSDFNFIVDDELKNIIKNNLKPNVTLIALFDSCFSGSVLDLRYEYMDSLYNNNYTENLNETETSGNIIMISGCSDIQTSADAIINNVNQGALTWAFLQSFQTNITWRQLMINMRNLLKTSQFTQIPQLASGNFMNIDTKVFI
uniref:Peptidase C14 caspase domain-containing protein n=1 Tax=viral metagenome TaxID=1070528 RepID=A0A6C0ER60_9ZZZZ